MYNFEMSLMMATQCDNLSRGSIAIILVTKARTQFDKSLDQKPAFENNKV